MPRFWEMAIIALTIAGLLLVVVEWGLPEAFALYDALYVLDDAICGVFFLDFALRFRRSGDRLTFLRRNWLDLLGAIPLVGPLRMVRLVRVFRIVRLWRAARGARHLLGRDIEVLGGSIGSVAVTTVVVWVASATVFYLVEHETNPGMHAYVDALWWAMTTLSTVGYGDLYPVTPAGRLIAMVTMVLGVGVLGTLAASLATALLELRDWARRGLGTTSMKDHLLVLGWSPRASTALSAFRLDPRYAELPIVIVADLERAPLNEPDAHFVRGAPSRREVLERASASTAARAVVFARDPNDPRSDHETALVVMALRKLNATARVSAEVVSSDNHEVVRDAGADTVVDTARLSIRLLVRSIQDVGVSEMVTDLLESADGSELYRVPVPADFVGRTYRDCAHTLIDRRASLLGLMRDGRKLVNPDGDLILRASDELFVLAPTPL